MHAFNQVSAVSEAKAFISSLMDPEWDTKDLDRIYKFSGELTTARLSLGCTSIFHAKQLTLWAEEVKPMQTTRFHIALNFIMTAVHIKYITAGTPGIDSPASWLSRML